MIDAIRYASSVCGDPGCELSRAARNVLHWMAEHVDRRTGETFVSAGRIAALSGFNVGSVRRAQHELEAAGVLAGDRLSGRVTVWRFPVASALDNYPQPRASRAGSDVHNPARHTRNPARDARGPRASRAPIKRSPYGDLSARWCTPQCVACAGEQWVRGDDDRMHPCPERVTRKAG